jgi:hypothetical protein
VLNTVSYRSLATNDKDVSTMTDMMRKFSEELLPNPLDLQPDESSRPGVMKTVFNLELEIN